MKMTSELYAKIATQVNKEIDGAHSINSCFEGEDYAFSLSAIIYRTRIIPQTCDQPAEGGDIMDIVPIWWEFHSYNEDGEETDNDFAFSELKKYLDYERF